MDWKRRRAVPTVKKPFVHSLRARMTIAVLFPLVLILGTFMVMQYRLQQNMLMNNLTLLASQTALTIEHSLQQAMMNHDRQDLQDILDSISQNEMLQDVYLMDSAGKVVFSPKGKQVGTVLSYTDENCQPCHRLERENRPASIVITLSSGQRFFRSMNPIENEPECQACHTASQRINGVLMTDISLQPLEASLVMDMWQHLILWAGAILVSIVVLNTVVDRFVLSRLESLSNALTKLGLGQPSPLISGNQRDEIGQVALAFNEMAGKIEARDEENRRLSSAIQLQSSERGELLKRLIRAQEDERARFARELHDELGQALAVLALQTRRAQNAIANKPGEAVRILDETQDLVGSTTEQMYNLILALRPSLLDDLGLAAALRSHCERLLKEAGIQFHLDATGLPTRLPPDLEVVLYRVFQEALTNAFRHSQAHKVTVTLALENGVFVGEVCDDGRGFDPALLHQNPHEPQGLGLAGMQERLLHHNGRLELNSTPGQGTRIKIIVPVQEDRHA